MRNDFFNNFFKTHDNKQISFLTNFNINDTEAHENVLVFNYGLVCSYQHWEYQIDFFHQQGYKILLHHYRGHFLSDGISSIEELSFQAICSDLINICRKLKLKSVIPIGHSMGVNISLEYATEALEQVKGLILISGTVKPVENVMFDSNLMSFLIPLLKEFRKSGPKLLEAIWKSSGHNPIVKKLIHTQGFNAKNVPLDYVEIYLNRVGKLGSEIFIKLFDEMSHHDIVTDLHKVKRPTLIIGGESDKVIPNYQQRLLSSLLENSELYIVKNGSHVPQVDFPELVNERVLTFLKDHQINPTLSLQNQVEA